MTLALFDDYRFGVVDADETQLHDVSEVVQGHDAEWQWSWLPRLVGNFEKLRPQVEDAARRTQRRSMAEVTLVAPVPWPGQLVAAAANYHEHAREMATREVVITAGQARLGPVEAS